MYRVISNPSQASETLVKNWAIQMECLFVTFLTLIGVASIYFSIWDRYSEADVRWSGLTAMVITC